MTGYWPSRVVFERPLAGVHVIALPAAANRFRPLLGSDGLTPLPRYRRRVPSARSRPHSLFHLHYSGRFFAAAWFGVAVSLALVAAAACSASAPGTRPMSPRGS